MGLSAGTVSARADHGEKSQSRLWSFYWSTCFAHEPNPAMCSSAEAAAPVLRCRLPRRRGGETEHEKGVESKLNLPGGECDAHTHADLLSGSEIDQPPHTIVDDERVVAAFYWRRAGVRSGVESFRYRRAPGQQVRRPPR